MNRILIGWAFLFAPTLCLAATLRLSPVYPGGQAQALDWLKIKEQRSMTFWVSDTCGICEQWLEALVDCPVFTTKSVQIVSLGSVSAAKKKWLGHRLSPFIWALDSDFMRAKITRVPQVWISGQVYTGPLSCSQLERLK